MKHDQLTLEAENQDTPDKQVSKLALRAIYNALKPHIGSGATQLTGDDADRLLADMAEVVAILVRANRLRVASDICSYLDMTLGPTPPCDAASTCSADPSGRTACPTDETGNPDCTGCPSAQNAPPDRDPGNLTQISPKKGGEKD